MAQAGGDVQHCGLNALEPGRDGDARIADVLTVLREGGYGGWYVLEQDIALKDAAADPLPGIERSRTFVSARV